MRKSQSVDMEFQYADSNKSKASAALQHELFNTSFSFLTLEIPMVLDSIKLA